MSEAERKRRIEYKLRRKRLITVQLALLLVVAILILAFALTYRYLNRTYYINYTENSKVDYSVKLKDNTFYEDEWLPGGQAYVASLIETVAADLKYNLKMEADDVNYKYSYSVVAILEILDKKANEPLYTTKDVIKPEATYEQNSSKELNINEKVNLDYTHYNRLAASFIDVYGLNDVRSTLSVSMDIHVVGNSASFESDSSNTYNLTLYIPLTTKTVSIEMGSSVPTEESKVLACKNAVNQDIFKNTAFILAVVEVFLLLLCIAFVYLTRNEDINYSIKVKRIYSSYRSFIQRINNPFNTAGYQLLEVNSFNEMLDIRDIIQSPILMNENEDQTCTRFVIPTESSLLYVFDLKVDDYDDIYKTYEPEEAESYVEAMAVVEPVVVEEPVVEEPVAEEPIVEEPVAEEPVVEEPVAEEPVVEEPVAEEPVVEEPVAEEPVAEEPIVEEPVAEEPVVEEPVVEEPVAEEPIVEEPVVEEPVVEEPIAEEPIAEEPAPEVTAVVTDGNDDNVIVNGEIIHIRYRSSFTSRLIQAGQPLQSYYTAVKNKLMSYKGIKARTSWAVETFSKTKVQYAKLNVKGKTLVVSLALDPKEYADTKYRFTDVSDDPKAERLPMVLKIKSPRGVKHALELIDIMMQKEGIAMGAEATEVYEMPYESNRVLALRGLVKIILPPGVRLEGSFEFVDADVDAHINSGTRTKSETVTDVETLAAIAAEAHIEVTEEEVAEVMEAPTVELEEIDFVDEIDEVYEESKDKPGVEVIGVVWPEHEHKNKIYRYDPNGETVEDGDIVLVPSRDVHRNKDIVRKAAVAHGNHKVDPDSLTHPLKKIIAVVKRKVEAALYADNKKK